MTTPATFTITHLVQSHYYQDRLTSSGAGRSECHTFGLASHLR